MWHQTHNFQALHAKFLCLVLLFLSIHGLQAQNWQEVLDAESSDSDGNDNFGYAHVIFDLDNDGRKEPAAAGPNGLNARLACGAAQSHQKCHIADCITCLAQSSKVSGTSRVYRWWLSVSSAATSSSAAGLSTNSSTDAP